MLLLKKLYIVAMNKRLVQHSGARTHCCKHNRINSSVARKCCYIKKQKATHCCNEHLPAYEDRTECSETSAYKTQTPGNYPEESIKHSEHAKV